MPTRSAFVDAMGLRSSIQKACHALSPLLPAMGRLKRIVVFTLVVPRHPLMLLQACVMACCSGGGTPCTCCAESDRGTLLHIRHLPVEFAYLANCLKHFWTCPIVSYTSTDGAMLNHVSDLSFHSFTGLALLAVLGPPLSPHFLVPRGPWLRSRLVCSSQRTSVGANAAVQY